MFLECNCSCSGHRWGLRGEAGHMGLESRDSLCRSLPKPRMHIAHLFGSKQKWWLTSTPAQVVSLVCSCSICESWWGSSSRPLKIFVVKVCLLFLLFHNRGFESDPSSHVKIPFCDPGNLVPLNRTIYWLVDGQIPSAWPFCNACDKLEILASNSADGTFA